MDEPQLFESTPEGKRRSVLFSIAVMTGFLTIAASTGAFVGTDRQTIALALGLIGVLAFALGCLLYLGRLGGLVDEDQLLWQLTE
jgi:spore maturation protein SpmA